MSRGPGRIQRAIDALIAGDAHGAWLVSDICKQVYPEFDGVEKKHQVAVNRALSSMALPKSWEARYSEARGGTRVLYNTGDPVSCAKADWLTKRDGFFALPPRRRALRPQLGRLSSTPSKRTRRTENR